MSDFDRYLFVETIPRIQFSLTTGEISKPTSVDIRGFWKDDFVEHLRVANPDGLDDLLGKGNWRKGHERYKIEFKEKKHMALFLLTYRK